MQKWHHANLIVGRVDPKNIVKEVLKNDLSFEVEKNPDYFIFEKETFGIDEARIFEKWSIGKPFVGEKKASLLIFDSITVDAQNALLKLLEEPKAGTYVFIYSNYDIDFLPTFLSRIRICNASDLLEKEEESKTTSKKFSSQKKFNKISFINDITKKDDSKKIIQTTLDEIENNLYNEISGVSRSNLRKLKAVLKAKKYISKKNIPSKNILEWLFSVVR